MYLNDKKNSDKILQGIYSPENGHLQAYKHSTTGKFKKKTEKLQSLAYVPTISISLTPEYWRICVCPNRSYSSYNF